jgi:translocation and assembly module TamB
MSDNEATPPLPEELPEPADQEPAVQAKVPRPRRLRRFFLRHLPLTVASAAVLLMIATAGLYFWASSASFENMVRRHLVKIIQEATGGRAEIASFHWRLLNLEAEADGVTIHGLEAPGEAPYVQADRLRVRVSVLGFWSPRILLRDLEILRPQLHLIVYPDGSTNQPHPFKPKKPGKPAIDTFFDLKAGHVEVEQGVLNYENRAAAFDFQNRHIPLDFNANDLSLRMAYVPAGASGSPASWGKGIGSQESYHIEAGVRDLSLSRGTSSKPAKASNSFLHFFSGKKAADQPVRGFVQATLDLTRTAAFLNSLRITAHDDGVKDRTLEISGSLEDFAHPHWQAKAVGDLDMRLLNPITGYPFAPQGLAHLDLNGAGHAGTFRADGTMHVEDGSYIGTGVVATGVGLDARLHADPEELLITSAVAHLRQGGQIGFEISLAHWLPTLPGAATIGPAETSTGRSRKGRTPPVTAAKPSSPDDITLPVNGKVTAAFKDVALDTVLEMVTKPPFRHLGFDTRISGPAKALWINGDVRTLAVDALLNLTPPAQIAQGKVPASGEIDATYTQRDGAVDLRKLELFTPASQLEVHGHLGAYPLSSASVLDVEFHSQNLGEFDTVLRDLGLTRNGKSGTAALPVALAGQVDFLHGSWNGSLRDPRISGSLKATQLTLELPASSVANSSQPQFVHLDSVDTTGSYSAARIEFSRGLVRRGKTEINLSGNLAAAARTPGHGQVHTPSFDGNSVLHLHLRAGQVGVDDIEPFIGRKLPVTGVLDTQLQLDGPLHALGGTGWVELNKGTVFGEPVARLRAQGNLANQLLNLTSLTVNGDAGTIAGAGSYNLQSHRFQLNANGAGIDLARIEVLRRPGLTVIGKLGFTAEGSGTLDDPVLKAHAILPNLSISGESMGALEVQAHAANHVVTYDLKTRLEAAELSAHGQTALSGDYATQAKVNFSQFNIGPLLKLAHVQGLNGESALAGTVTLEGPLARLSELRGEARLQELAVTVSGVHLKSDGVHATLEHAIIHLDPLHVTGEETDLHAQGTLSLKDKRQLDFSASGAINLKVAETLDPDLTAHGNVAFQVEAHGPLMNPDLRGRIDFKDGALSLEDVPNSLSQLHGTMEFNQNRLEVKNLTAMTGGGLLSVSGFLAYQNGLYADLTATGNGIRIRYPPGVSSLADASLHLQGPRNNLLLSGNVLITRFTVSPDLDIAALAAQAGAVETIAPPDAPSNHIRLDVHIASSPQLNFQNAYAKLAGNVDLHLRGTVASPSLLGRVSITEGSAVIAGTRYDLQRGDVYFTNPVRIQPNIDLNATARVEDYDITLGLHGTPEKMAVTYRSDPPLPEADVVALLALGRTGNQQRLYTQQQQQALANPTTDALLGGALNATVSSRVQKLFGAGSVKLDPNYLGALGNSTSRIIVEEQLGRNLTLTYATNVNTTGQQLIQAEIAINRHVSLQLARDESGVFSMVVKATRRFR